MANTNTGSRLQRIFSAIAALCFASILASALIALVKTQEMTNLLAIVVTMLFVIVMVLDKKDLFATVGVGCFALWKIITFFLAGSMTAMWFKLAYAIIVLYLTFLVSRREKTEKDLRTAGLFGWVPGVLAVAGLFFYLSYACNGIPMRYWIYSIQNGQRINLHYIGLELIEVLGVIAAGLWTAFNPEPAQNTPEESQAEQQELPEEQAQDAQKEQEEQSVATDTTDTADTTDTTESHPEQAPSDIGDADAQ